VALWRKANGRRAFVGWKFLFSITARNLHSPALLQTVTGS